MYIICKGKTSGAGLLDTVLHCMSKLSSEVQTLADFLSEKCYGFTYLLKKRFNPFCAYSYWKWTSAKALLFTEISFRYTYFKSSFGKWCHTHYYTINDCLVIFRIIEKLACLSSSEISSKDHEFILLTITEFSLPLPFVIWTAHLRCTVQETFTCDLF